MTYVELLISSTPVDYPAAVAFMEARVAAIHEGTAREAVWFLEHPPLFTAGTSAKTEGHLGTLPFPVYEAGRGGEHTYHGPGQRVAYLMLDVGSRGKDIRAFVSAVEAWVREALGEFSLMPRTYPDRVGLWVDKGQSEAKIAAIGIRLKRWVSLHGVAINVTPDLAHFGGIIPCGITQFGVTSLEDLGLPVTMADLDVALIKHFAAAFAAPLTTPQSLNI